MQRSVKNGSFYSCYQWRLINKAKKYKSDISEFVIGKGYDFATIVDLLNYKYVHKELIEKCK
jgi:hypothetical protein